MRMTKYNTYQGIAERAGFIFERVQRQACGDGDYIRYELCTNHKHLGMGTTACYQTLNEAWGDLLRISDGINPLTGDKLLPI